MIIVLIIAELVIIGIVLGGARDQDLSVTRLSTVHAFYAADAGMNMALREIATATDDDGDGEIGSISDDGNDANDLDIGPAQVRVSVDRTALATTLTSTARCGEAMRDQRLVIEPEYMGAPGMFADYYSSASVVNTILDIDWDAMPSHSSLAASLNLPRVEDFIAGWPGGPASNWGMRTYGWITIPQSGTWTFYTNSDDGSKLWIDDVLVVDNDGVHAMQTRSGTVNLTAGLHTIEVKWIERYIHQGLIVSWSGPGVPSQTVIPAGAYTH